MITTMSFREIGKLYNMSDNGIKKLCKRYGLPSTKYELGLRNQEPIPNKICPNCGKEFHPSDRKQICCNRDCQIEYAKYKTILKPDGTPIIEKEIFLNFAKVHTKQETYRHFNITRYNYSALEYYFLNKT